MNPGFAEFNGSRDMYLTFLNQWYSMINTTNDFMPSGRGLHKRIMDSFKFYSRSLTYNVEEMYLPRNIPTIQKEELRRFNTMWTLKHHKYSPELTSLMPNVKVYISKIDLEHCKKVATKCTQLARMLMKHIFTESALKYCLLCRYTVVGGFLFKLDQIAVEVIVYFTLYYGRISRWAPSCTKSLKNAMRYQLFLSKQRK